MHSLKSYTANECNKVLNRSGTFWQREYFDRIVRNRNDLTKKSYELLNNDQKIKNFIGNVEGRDIFTNKVDVVVTDGFVGNVVLKTTEGAASFFIDLLKESFKTNLRSKIAAFLLKPYFASITKF